MENEFSILSGGAGARDQPLSSGSRPLLYIFIKWVRVEKENVRRRIERSGNPCLDRSGVGGAGAGAVEKVSSSVVEEGRGIALAPYRSRAM